MPLESDEIKSDGSFTPAIGYDMAWIRNYSSHFSMSFIDYDFLWAGGDRDLLHFGIRMGCIIRSNMLNGKFTLFAWPTFGWCTQSGQFDVAIKRYKNATWRYSGFDWQVKAGTYIGRQFLASALIGAHRYGLQIGYIL